MNLHSCRSTKRKKKRLPMANTQKSVCALQYSKHRVWGLPSTKTRTEMFWYVQNFFSFSNYQILGSLFFTWGILHMIQSSFLLPFYPLSLASLFSPCSLSQIHFRFPQKPSNLSEYFAYLDFFPFLQPQSSLFISLPILSCVSRACVCPFPPPSFPSQPCPAALGDPSTFPREEVPTWWWLTCWQHGFASTTLQTWADDAWSVGFRFPQQASFPLHRSASCKAEICIF